MNLFLGRVYHHVIASITVNISSTALLVSSTALILYVWWKLRNSLKLKTLYNHLVYHLVYATVSATRHVLCSHLFDIIQKCMPCSGPVVCKNAFGSVPVYCYLCASVFGMAFRCLWLVKIRYTILAILTLTTLLVSYYKLLSSLAILSFCDNLTVWQFLLANF